MDCYPVYPGFETLSIFILVDVREDFQERILHGFFRFTAVADNAQASYVQSLCELFVQAQLRTPFSFPATLYQLYCCFVHLFI